MIIQLIVLLLGIPVGLLIAWLARDELIQGRKYLLSLLILIFVGVLLFFGNEPVLLTLGFMSFVTFISYIKSFDSKLAVVRKV